jgi:hypothetical protein
VIATTPPAVSSKFVDAISGPLPTPRLIGIGTALVLVMAAYCQAYCVIAFQPMRGMRMPPAASLIWAIGAVAPWVVCFELCKRRDMWGRSRAIRTIAYIGLFCAAAAVSIILELGLDRLIGAHQTRPLSMQIAAQIPAAALTGCFLFLGKAMTGSHAVPPTTAARPLVEIAAEADAIDWIQAAGNYVEVHSRGGMTMHRLTMRELESALDPRRFVRIHRSVIVNAAAITGRAITGGVPAVRIRDGTVQKIGPRFRANLERLTSD